MPAVVQLDAELAADSEVVPGAVVALVVGAVGYFGYVLAVEAVELAVLVVEVVAAVGDCSAGHLVAASSASVAVVAEQSAGAGSAVVVLSLALHRHSGRQRLLAGSVVLTSVVEGLAWLELWGLVCHFVASQLEQP